ncbi:hypothetical protein JCM5350_007510 [Sporobolomyces pararoseus]
MPPRSRTLSTQSLSSLPRDISSFLSNYPSNPSNPLSTSNLDFYQNRLSAKPSKKKIKELQESLKGDFKELEFNHSFIQWLFPIREQGVNYQAKPLELHEIDQLKRDKVAMDRLIESYRIMLEFYGLKLISPLTGELALEDSVPAPSPNSYLKRFENLEKNSHNFLRITRILKCLNEFGFPQHPPSLLLYILTLQSSRTNPHLTSPGLIRSMDNYWRHCIRDEKDRGFVGKTIERVRKNQGEVWTVEEYREWVKGRALERNHIDDESEGEGEKKKRKNDEKEGDGDQQGERKKWCSIL